MNGTGLARCKSVLYLFLPPYRAQMAANYNRPKPIDPIWYRTECYISIRCACGRQRCERVGAFAAEAGVSFNIALYELIRRLRCTKCNGRPFAEVTRYRGGN